MARTYDMTNRARRAAQTTERIVTSTEGLLASGPLADVTLPAIAEGAGVTVQTVLRHMGSRDGCLHAVGERVARRVEAQRGASRPGDVEGAICSLVAHYEAEGRLVLNLLAQEHDGETVAREGVERGRTYHRAWAMRVFGLGPCAADRVRVDALVAATDLYVWKLLRLDLRRSVATTEATMVRLARGVMADGTTQAPPTLEERE
ncbi:MAG TPA: TetR/AcrR family transcriptional regulator [Longimicrobiales bacterium]|nr:TetR/AcrR family transcriptional regulator [Longimicrobiales bacterium]